MAVTTTQTNKPINPRGNDQSPKGYNRAALYSGKALDFDGVNDRLDGGSIDALGTGDFSYSVYFNPDGFSTYHGLFAIGTIYNFGLLTKQTTGEIYAYSTTTGNIDSGYLLKDGEWQNITFVRSGTSHKFYINGVLFSDITDTAFSVSADNYKIGQVTSFFANGQYSNARLFNTALTAAQVADLYNNPEKVVPTGVDNTALKLWLPMQEGAGTTAYDGSGNGNHGTISGATWTHGIGAPVSQTAVIDWNKGTNYVDYSNDFTQSSWTTARATLTSGQSGVLGSSDAWKIESNATGFTGGYDNTTSLNVVNCSSIYAKAGNIDYLFIASTQGSTNNAQYFNLTTGTLGSLVGSGITSADIEDVGDGWYRCSVVMSANASFGYMLFGLANTDANNESVSGEYIYIQNAQLNNGSSVGVYTPTIGTPQTSPVLLPQGLTSGRDITGVNLFENVRKQGALNLDGNSWAEVHDNASLDVSEITAEGWMYAESITSANNRIVNKWNSGYPERSFQLYGQNNTINWMLSDGSAAYSITGGTLTQGQWYHVVGTYDGATQKIYLNGVQVATTALSITLKQSSFKVMIGGYVTGLYSLNPTAQPRIYNRALTAEEVQRNFDAGKNTYTN